jgi:hypothetical protein
LRDGGIYLAQSLREVMGRCPGMCPGNGKVCACRGFRHGAYGRVKRGQGCLLGLIGRAGILICCSGICPSGR